MAECCDAMQNVLDNSDGPFYRPVYIDREHNLTSGELAVKTYRLTPSQKVMAAAGRRVIFLTYCPFCGKDLGK